MCLLSVPLSDLEGWEVRRVADINVASRSSPSSSALTTATPTTALATAFTTGLAAALTAASSTTALATTLTACATNWWVVDVQVNNANSLGSPLGLLLAALALQNTHTHTRTHAHAKTQRG